MSAYTFSTCPCPEPITELDQVVVKLGSKGKTTTVSAIDKDLFDKYTYSIGTTGYVISSGQNKKDGANSGIHKLHQKVLEQAGIDVPKGMVVDHRNQNKANNV